MPGISPTIVVGEGKEEPVPQDVGEREAVLLAVGENVPEGVQEVGEMVPGEEQVAGQVQGRKAESPAEGQ